VVAPAAGKVIARIGPMLGMLPDIVDMPAINQALSIPLQPGRPAGAPARGPGAPAAPLDASAKTVKQETKPHLTVPATVLPPALSRPAPDVRRETRLLGSPARATPVAAR
jgi:cell division protein FtsI (penicillin-binding protein 3)